jgi:hypothetical protein
MTGALFFTFFYKVEPKANFISKAPQLLEPLSHLDGSMPPSLSFSKFLF